MEKNYCRIRKDLLEDDIMIPLSINSNYTYIGTSRKKQYRWINDDEQFQIKHCGKWYNAESIDFEF